MRKDFTIKVRDVERKSDRLLLATYVCTELDRVDIEQMSVLIPCFMLAIEAGSFTCLPE